MGAACRTYGGQKCKAVLVGKPEWRPLQRPRRRWGDTIKTDIKEIR